MELRCEDLIFDPEQRINRRSCSSACINNFSSWRWTIFFELLYFVHT